MNFMHSNGPYVAKLLVWDKHVYIKLSWKPNESDLFHIKIYDGANTWSGRFSNEFAQKFQDTIGEKKEDYNANVLKCLCGHDNKYFFEMPVPSEGESSSFNWKKRFSGVTMLCGKVPIHRDTHPESKDQLVDILLNENSNLRIKIGEINSNIELLNSELEKYKLELERYVDIKTSLEMTLYTRFMHLLNAKKRRIQLLEENMTKIEELFPEDRELE